MKPQIELLPKQLRAFKYWHDTLTKVIVYGGAKGSAKSFLGCNLIFMDALTRPGTHYFIARKQLNDLRNHTRPSIREWFNVAGIPIDTYSRFDGRDNFYELHNGSRIYLIDAKDLPSDPLFERFGSMQITRGWIEEGGQFNYHAYANLLLSIGRWQNTPDFIGKLLITCNPKKNFLYHDFYKPFKEGKLEADKQFIQSFAWENPFLTEDYINTLKNTKDETTRQRLFHGNWDYDNDPTKLCDYDAILNSFDNIHVRRGETRITADIATHGNDDLVICVWMGRLLIDIERLPISGGKQIIGALNRMRKKYNIPPSHIIYDADGVGNFIGKKGGFIEQAKPFNNNGRPSIVKKEGYRNLKAYCAYLFAEQINENNYYFFALADDEHWKEKAIQEIDQLKSIHTDDDLKNLDIVPKKQIKNILNRSPDFLDCCIMNEYFDIVPKNTYKGIYGYDHV